MLESSTPIGASAAADTAASAPANQGPAEGISPGDGGKAGGLRERKKQQTRLRIIDVAFELCATQGFDATTVEQIANHADVSPRTVNRYFDMKEDIVLGPIDDFGRAVADALREEPDTGNELRSLCDAYLRTIDEATAETSEVPFRKFQQMQRIIRDSPSVGTRVLEYSESKSAAIADVLAQRLGTEPDALPVRLILATWQMLCHVAMDDCGELVMNGDPETAARAARDTLWTAYAEFMRVCTGCPPAESL